MKKITITILTLLSLLLTGCSEKGNTIIVLTSSGYEPYEIVDTNGKLTGFDIELMEAIALEANLNIKWKDVDFEGIIGNLQAGTADMAIAGITPTKLRSESVDFSTTYFNSEFGLVNYLIFDKNLKIFSVDDLKGLTIGAQLGTIQGELLSESSSNYDYKADLRSNNTQIVEEIKSGRIDALLIEKSAAATILNLNSDFDYFVLESNLDTLSGNAIAFPKGSTYAKVINEALDTLIDNGTVEVLINKWFK